MATSANTSLPMWLAGCTYDGSGGNDLRNSGIATAFYGVTTGSVISVLGGVLGGAGLWVQPGTGMAVTVQQGSFVVPVTASPAAGGYASTLSSAATLTVQTADPANPRIDIVVANVVDNGNSTSFGEVQIITGTPASSPSAPAAPANSITLARVSVPAGTTSITSGLITDKRPYTTAFGGVLRAPKGTVAGYSGQLAYDPPSNSFYHNSGTGVQAHILPFAPAIAARTSQILTGVGSGGWATILSVNVTTDGLTDLDIFAQWPGFTFSFSPSSAWRVQIGLFIDTTQVDGLYVTNPTMDGSPRGGGSIRHITSSVTSDTPNAATHTVSLKATSLDLASQTYVYATAAQPISLRAAAVTL